MERSTAGAGIAEPPYNAAKDSVDWPWRFSSSEINTQISPVVLVILLSLRTRADAAGQLAKKYIWQSESDLTITQSPRFLPEQPVDDLNCSPLFFSFAFPASSWPSLLRP